MRSSEPPADSISYAMRTMKLAFIVILVVMPIYILFELPPERRLSWSYPTRLLGAWIAVAIGHFVCRLISPPILRRVLRRFVRSDFRDLKEQSGT